MVLRVTVKYWAAGTTDEWQAFCRRTRRAFATLLRYTGSSPRFDVLSDGPDCAHIAPGMVAPEQGVRGGVRRDADHFGGVPAAAVCEQS